MKIKDIEKIIIVAVLSLLITVAYYNFYYVNAKVEVEDLKEEKANYDTRLTKLKNTIKDIPKKEEEIKIINSKIDDKTRGFYPKLIQEKLILEIDKLMEDSNILGNISFSDMINGQADEKNSEGFDKALKGEDLNKTANEFNASDKNKEAINSGAQGVEGMKLVINFMGKYTDVLKFIKSIDEYSRKIAFTNINLSQTAIDAVNGSMSLEFYALPKIGSGDLEYFKWELNNPYGKLNIFDSNQEVSPSENIENTVVKEKNYDLVMSLKPVESDLPTVALGKGKDSDRKSYVYADNSKEEKVEIYFEEKDGKYYFKYKTSRGSYPVNFQGIGEEFSLKDENINLKIYSTKRLSEKDTSSANIQIYNKTNKTLVIVVEDDDPIRPRANINGNSGSIEVKKN